MNVAGDLRYVTRDGMRDFDGTLGRRRAFAPGGPIARRLAERGLTAIVGDTLFVHGGVLPTHDLTALEREARAWLRGDSAAPPRALVDDDSPLWTRTYGGDETPAVCATARAALANTRSAAWSSRTRRRAGHQRHLRRPGVAHRRRPRETLRRPDAGAGGAARSSRSPARLKFEPAYSAAMRAALGFLACAAACAPGAAVRPSPAEARVTAIVDVTVIPMDARESWTITPCWCVTAHRRGRTGRPTPVPAAP